MSNPRRIENEELATAVVGSGTICSSVQQNASKSNKLDNTMKKCVTKGVGKRKKQRKQQT
jgi:hypothetical protein